MPRLGGNPDIAAHGFKSKEDWRGSCTEKMTLRMPPNMKQAIKDGEVEEWQEICRLAIAVHLGWQVPDASLNTPTNQ